MAVMSAGQYRDDIGLSSFLSHGRAGGSAAAAVEGLGGGTAVTAHQPPWLR